MKNLRRAVLCLSLLLSMLAIQVRAGEMGFPVQPPPPTQSAAASSSALDELKAIAANMIKIVLAYH